MAIQPSKIISKIQEEADSLEEDIDNILEESRPEALENGTLSISFSYYAEVRQAVANELKKRYVKAGWDDMKLESIESPPPNPIKTKITLVKYQ